MGLKVIWTDYALNQLEQIFDFFKYTASINVSKKIVAQIIDKTLLLENNPFIGSKEPLLENRSREYRYLVEGNYKIIYSVEGNIVRVNSIFDCRQSPIKVSDSSPFVKVL